MKRVIQEQDDANHGGVTNIMTAEVILPEGLESGKESPSLY